MGRSDSNRETETLFPIIANGGSGGGGHSYLLVVEGSASYVHYLPPKGDVIIGRGQDADVHIDDPAASRRHACLTITQTEVRVRDLESHNGTLVNGEPATLPRSLISGDIIGICSAILILQRHLPSQRCPSTVTFAQLRQRLDEEIDRASRYQRPLALVVFEMGASDFDRDAVLTALSEELRLSHVLAWGATSRLFMIMPEVPAQMMSDAAARMLRILQTLAPQARAAFASFPIDGTDGDTLLASARAAAQATLPTGVGTASDLKRVRTIKDEEVILADPAMFSVYDLVERLAPDDIPVLIGGETGTGKELVARALHFWSPRQRFPLVNINSAALQDSLAESMLFGHVRGAFTGATSDHSGFFEQAGHGTVFFDEIGEVSPAIQAKLLRALDSRRIQPLGSTREVPIHARIVTATNRDLKKEVREGRFRQDLYYRLNSSVISLPPLHARPRELPILSRAFLESECRRRGRPVLSLTDPVLERLQAYRWPGNIRELKNVMTFLASTVAEPTVELWHLPAALRDLLEDESGAAPTMILGSPERSRRAGARSLSEEVKQLEIQRIQQALAETSSNVQQAATRLNMPLRTLYHKLKQYGLK